ncbi:unnamed protein product [Urochloa humidicola]
MRGPARVRDGPGAGGAKGRAVAERAFSSLTCTGDLAVLAPAADHPRAQTHPVKTNSLSWTIGHSSRCWDITLTKNGE